MFGSVSVIIDLPCQLNELACRAVYTEIPTVPIVLVTSIAAQLIGVRPIPIGIGTILLLPLLFAFVFTLVLNPNVTKPIGKVLSTQRVRLVDAAYEKRSVAISSNLHPSGFDSCSRRWPPP
jgi:hypothetical protein